MQTSLLRYKRMRLSHPEEEKCRMTNGVIVPLQQLTTLQLTELQQSLTVVPRATFRVGNKATGPADEPISCFTLSANHVSVPRAFGYQRFGDRTIDELQDGRPMTLNFVGDLNEAQTKARDAVMAGLARAPYSGILVLPCGFGKTVLGLWLAARLGRRCMIIVHKDFLLEQWQERIGTFLPGAKVGVLQQARTPSDDCDIVIAMLHTLIRRPDPALLDTFGTCIVDEFHHMAARYFSEGLKLLKCRYLLGMTATLDRKDGTRKVLHFYLGEVLFEVLKREKEAVDVHIHHFASNVQPREASTGPEQSRLKTMLTQLPARNEDILRLIVQFAPEGRNILVLSERKDHVRHLLEALQARAPEFPAGLYVGGQKTEERVKTAQDAQVIFGTFQMASEGLDIPKLDTLILASPYSDLVQSVGRILRPSKTKQRPLIIDIADDFCLHFSRLNAKRRAFYLSNGYSIRGEGETSLSSAASDSVVASQGTSLAAPLAAPLAASLAAPHAASLAAPHAAPQVTPQRAPHRVHLAAEMLLPF